MNNDLPDNCCSSLQSTGIPDKLNSLRAWHVAREWTPPSKGQWETLSECKCSNDNNGVTFDT